MTNIIEFNNISKKYRIYFGTKSIRNSFSDFISKIKGKPAQNKSDFFALKNVSFAVPKGTTLGLIGSNGSGKSTILKLITKVTYPTTGNLKVKGRVASLLEIGAGFHFELTGRENIYLNGALLGLTKKQIDSKFDEIVEFSELKQFIDTPIKKYSSGMYIKLGFSVAIHVDPEILLVDEVLSVGDANFQNKCIKKMREIVSDTERTVILVSHNMVTIQALCDMALWVEKGNIRAFDETNKVISMYSEEINKRISSYETEGERLNIGAIHASEMRTSDINGNRKSNFYNETMCIELKYKVNEQINEKMNIIFVIEAVDLGMPIFSISTKSKLDLNTNPGDYKILCSIELKNLYPRECSIRVHITSEDMLVHYDTWYDSCRFSVTEPESNILISTGIADIVKLDYSFKQ
jgi:lipopolysaccharide transport system ATP-binding protein